MSDNRNNQPNDKNRQQPEQNPKTPGQDRNHEKKRDQDDTSSKTR